MSENINQQIFKKVGKKIISTSIGLLVTTNVALNQTEKTQAKITDSPTPIEKTINENTREIQMTPVTTVEDFYNNDLWSQNIISNYYNLLNPQDINKYKYIGIPMDKKNISQIDSENKRKANFYNIKWVPQFIINGNTKEIEKWYDLIGLKILKENIKTKKQYIDFSLKIEQNPDKYILNITSLNDELNNNRNLNLNAIVLKREVNCEDKNDDFNTTIQKQVTYQYPLGALGVKIYPQKGETIQKSLDKIRIKQEKAMCGLVAFIQDMKTKEIIAASYTDLTPEKTALFNIDHLPETTLANIEKIVNMTTLREANIGMDNKKEYREQIGLRQKVISVTDVQNLRHLDIQLDYTDAEAQIYDVLGAGLSEELQDKAKLEYDPQEHRVTIKFNEPLNGNHDIFSFFIKIKKETINGMDSRQYDTKDVNFKWKTFSAQDSEFNTIKYELREQKNCYPVRMVTIDNPLDFNDDKVINEKDIDRFLPAFGVTDKDSNYIEAYDIYPQNIKEGTQGDGRIDVQDLYLLVKEVSEQEALAKKIKEINPDFIYPTDESIKAQVLDQICQLLPPLQLSEDQELNIEAINNYLDTIYSTRDKVIEQIKHTKSFLDRVKDFFQIPTPQALVNKREEEMGR